MNISWFTKNRNQVIIKAGLWGIKGDCKRRQREEEWGRRRQKRQVAERRVGRGERHGERG
jgi:hypothetical protein